MERHAVTLAKAATILEDGVDGAPRALKADEVAALQVRMRELAGVAAQVDLAMERPDIGAEERDGLDSLRRLLEDAGVQVHGVLDRAGGSLPPRAQQRMTTSRQPAHSAPAPLRTQVGPRESVSQAGGALPPAGDAAPMPTREEDAQFFAAANEVIRQLPPAEDTRSLGYGATVFFRNNPPAKKVLAKRVDRWLDDVVVDATTASTTQSAPLPPKSALLSADRGTSAAKARFGSAPASASAYETPGLAGAADSLQVRQEQLARANQHWGPTPRTRR